MTVPNTSRRTIGLAALGLLAAGCGSGGAINNPPASQGTGGGGTATTGPATRTKVRLALNWTPLADHAPYFVAKQKGWFEAAGADVDIQFGKGSADSAQRAATGQTDLAVSDASSVVSAAGKGAELLIVGMLFAQGPQAIWSKKSANITKPADLVGKKVGVPNADSQRVLFPALAKKNNVDPSKVEFVNIAPTAKYGALATGQVDAIFDFTTGKPFVDKAVGAENAALVRWSDHGLNLYGNALTVKAEYAKANSALLKKVLEAIYKGWKFTAENPDEALAIMKQQVNEVDIPTFKENLQLVLQLFKDKDYVEKGMGYMNEQRMCDTVAVVQEYVPVDKKPECKVLWTNEYLTKVDLPANLKP